MLKSRQVEQCGNLEHFNGVPLLQTKAGGSVGSCHALSVKSEADALMENSNVITSIKLYAIQSHYLGVESVSLAVGGHQLLQSGRGLDLKLRGIPTSVLHLNIQYLSMLKLSFVIVNIRINFVLVAFHSGSGLYEYYRFVQKSAAARERRLLSNYLQINVRLSLLHGWLTVFHRAGWEISNR